MPRGGKRSGAGRKAQLDPDEIESIRQDCEQRASRLQYQQAVQRHDRKMEKRGFIRDEDGETDAVHQAPLEERPAIIRFGIDEPDNHNLPEALSEEARYAINFIRTNKKYFGFYSEKLPRLANGRQEIIDAVARDWGISSRTVRSIWESKSEV